MTSLPERRVRRLLLRAPDQSLVTHGRALIEDALRTASLPAIEPGRVLVVRRLNLGAIRGTLSPSSVALIVEKRLAEARLQAVHVDAAQAEHAPAVYFRDAVEPVVCFAARLARHADITSWYWPLVLPEFRWEVGHSAAWRVVVNAVVHHETAPAAVLQLVRTLHAEATLDELLRALEPADGAALLSVFGWSLPPVLGVSSSGPDVIAPTSAWRPVVRRWHAEWGPSEARSAWLAAIAVVAGRPVAIADPSLPARALAALSPVVLHPVSAPQARRATMTPLHREVRVVPLKAAHNTNQYDHPSARASEQQHHFEDMDVAVPAPAAGEEPGRDWPIDYQPQEPVPTAFGGFYFLLPLLNRLGLTTLLEERPDLLDAEFPVHLLRYSAERLRVPLDDPVRLPLSTTPELPPPGAELQTLIENWFGSMRRWSRRNARIGLVDLTRRPAIVEVTQTHVDISFELHRVDMRVRRAGLDIDPGWIPWLGRVVLFHYL